MQAVGNLLEPSKFDKPESEVMQAAHDEVMSASEMVHHESDVTFSPRSAMKNAGINLSKKDKKADAYGNSKKVRSRPMIGSCKCR